MLAIGYIIRDGQIDVCSVLFKCEVPGCGAAHSQETQNLEVLQGPAARAPRRSVDGSDGSDNSNCSNIT